MARSPDDGRAGSMAEYTGAGGGVQRLGAIGYAGPRSFPSRAGGGSGRGSGGEGPQRREPRAQLAPGATIAGPAIVEERESTVVIGPGAGARSTSFGTWAGIWA